jgi:hypothetical protein
MATTYCNECGYGRLIVSGSNRGCSFCRKRRLSDGTLGMFKYVPETHSFVLVNKEE